MAEARFSQDEFLCPVCLDLLKDPVTIQCGHSYCKSCITDCWDQEDEKGVYSCPQCRQTFSPRPALGKNTILAEMVEKLKTKLQSAPAGAGDVQCDVSTGRKYKAVKSCLVCLESYCQTNFECHSFFIHVNHTKWLKPLDDCRRWSARNMRSSFRFSVALIRNVCLLCMVDKHKNHNTVSAAAQRTEKQVFNTTHWLNIAVTRFICVYISTHINS